MYYISHNLLASYCAKLLCKKNIIDTNPYIVTQEYKSGESMIKRTEQSGCHQRGVSTLVMMLNIELVGYIKRRNSGNEKKYGIM